MSKINVISILVIFSFLISCQDSQNLDSPIFEIKVGDGASLDVISDLSSHVKFSPLETSDSILISSQRFYLYDDSLLFIADRQQKTIYVFDHNGRFHNKIASLGRGPDEVLEIRDFYIDNKQKRIEIWDNGNKKLVCYEYDGEFVSSQKMPHADNFTKLVNGNYLIYCRDSDGGTIKLLDPTGSVINEFLERDEKYDGLPTAGCSQFFSSNPNGSVSFLTRYSPNVYTINDEKLYEKYHLDFGQNDMSSFLSTLPDDYKKKKKALNESLSTSYYHSYNEFSSCFFFSYKYKGRYYYALANKENHNVKILHKYLLSSSSRTSFFMHLLLHDDYLLGVVDASYLLRAISELSESEKIEVLKSMPSLQNIMLHSSPKDNPILVTIKLD